MYKQPTETTETYDATSRLAQLYANIEGMVRERIGTLEGAVSNVFEVNTIPSGFLNDFWDINPYLSNPPSKDEYIPSKSKVVVQPVSDEKDAVQGENPTVNDFYESPPTILEPIRGVNLETMYTPSSQTVAEGISRTLASGGGDDRIFYVREPAGTGNGVVYLTNNYVAVVDADGVRTNSDSPNRITDEVLTALVVRHNANYGRKLPERTIINIRPEKPEKIDLEPFKER